MFLFIIVSVPLLEHKPHQGGALHLFCSLPYHQCIEQCLIHRKYSRNMCWRKYVGAQLTTGVGYVNLLMNSLFCYTCQEVYACALVWYVEVTIIKYFLGFLCIQVNLLFCKKLAYSLLVSDVLAGEMCFVPIYIYPCFLYKPKLNN